MGATGLQVSDFVAGWGAVVATTLAGIRIYEVIGNRPRLEADSSFSSSSDGANTIVICNTGTTPALVNYWELTWARRHYCWTVLDRFQELPEDGRCDITIPSHGRATLTFRYQRWFPITREIEGRQVKLYLKLFLAGRRRCIWLQVYPFD